MDTLGHKPDQHKQHYRKRHIATIPVLGLAVLIGIIGLSVNNFANSQRNDHTHSHAVPETFTGETILITAEAEGNFSPQVLGINTGTNVTWEEAGGSEKMIMLETDDTNDESGQQAQSLKNHVFSKTGTYNFWSPDSPQKSGQIIVR